MTVTEINNRHRCQQSTRAEAALKCWGFFDETPDTNCKLLNTLKDEKRKDDEAINRKGR